MLRAFARDWETGIPLKEMAAMYGFRSTRGVSDTARRNGLKKRPGGSSNALSNGRWVPGPHGTRVWKGDIE